MGLEWQLLAQLLELEFWLKCFPKDMMALIGLADQLGVETELLDTAWKKNLKIRKVKDWEEIPFAVTKKNSD